MGKAGQGVSEFLVCEVLVDFSTGDASTPI